ncbi:MAG: hypothetical protein ACE5IP_03805 [Terriglobia bacterium]
MSLSLLNPTLPRPPNPWRKRLVIAAIVLAVAGGLAYWQFRYYPEKRQVERFMESLVAGDYRKAYEIWNPSPTYTYPNFLEDWGETTPFGRVRTYEIVAVQPASELLLQVPGEGGRRRVIELRGASSGLVVSVRINGNEPPVRIWVERGDKSLSFPPF